MESEVGIEAASNLTATCSSTALGRDVAAAAFRLTPLALRRMDFASLGVEPAAERLRRRCLRSAGREASWLPAERIGGQAADQSGGVSAKRRRKQFGFRRNPLRTADSWKTFAWLRLSRAWLRLSRALLRLSRALAEGPAAWTIFSPRGVRNAAAASFVQSGSTWGTDAGSTVKFLDNSSRRFSGYRLTEVRHDLFRLITTQTRSMR